MPNPVLCNGRAGIYDVEDFHYYVRWIIRYCPHRRGEVYLHYEQGTFLIVEDNMDNYELVRFMLERDGYDVFLAVNGRDGVDAASLQKPDLIIMDMGMPEMDGWTASRIKI